MHDYLTMLNERDGGIGGDKLDRRGMRDRLQHPEGHRVLRARSRASNPVVITPYSTGITLSADSESGGRQDPDPVDGLWPVGLGAGRYFPLDLQSARHLLGRRCRSSSSYVASAKAASTSSRARPSATSISTRPMARSRSRCFSRWPRTTASRSSSIRCRHEMQNQISIWLGVRRDRPDYMYHAGLGRDASDRGRGSSQERLRYESPGRRVVVRWRR